MLKIFFTGRDTQSKKHGVCFLEIFSASTQCSGIYPGSDLQRPWNIPARGWAQSRVFSTHSAGITGVVMGTRVRIVLKRQFLNVVWRPWGWGLETLSGTPWGQKHVICLSCSQSLMNIQWSFPEAPLHGMISSFWKLMECLLVCSVLWFFF